MTLLGMLGSPTKALREEVSSRELSSARVQVRVPSLARGTSASGLRRKESSEDFNIGFNQNTVDM